MQVKKQIIRTSFLLAIFLISVYSSQAATFSDNFDSYADEAAVESAGWGLDYTTLESTGCRSGKCLRVNIPSSGTNWYVTRPLNEAAPYIRFYAKRTNFNGSGGNKFLKLFGEGGSSNYANITFGQIYQTGEFAVVSTGDGMGLANDTVCNWYWQAHSLPCIGTAVVQNGNLIMADNRWYEFEFHIFPNTNGNNDGVIQIWVDGILRVHYTGVKMRNDANVRNFSSFSLVNYANYVTAPYQIWVDDLEVSQSHIGTISGDTTPPAAPTGLTIN